MQGTEAITCGFPRLAPEPRQRVIPRLSEVSEKNRWLQLLRFSLTICAKTRRPIGYRAFFDRCPDPARHVTVPKLLNSLLIFASQALFVADFISFPSI